MYGDLEEQVGGNDNVPENGGFVRLKRISRWAPKRSQDETCMATCVCVCVGEVGEKDKRKDGASCSLKRISIWGTRRF